MLGGHAGGHLLAWSKRLAISVRCLATRGERRATRVENLATRVECLAIRVKCVATRVECLATEVEQRATRVERLATRVKRVATRVERVQVVGPQWQVTVEEGLPRLHEGARLCRRGLARPLLLLVLHEKVCRFLWLRRRRQLEGERRHALLDLLLVELLVEGALVEEVLRVPLRGARHAVHGLLQLEQRVGQTWRTGVPRVHRLADPCVLRRDLV